MAQDKNFVYVNHPFCAFMACNVVVSEYNNNGTCKCLSCPSTIHYCNNGCSYLQQLMNERETEKLAFYEDMDITKTTLFQNRCQRCMNIDIIKGNEQARKEDRICCYCKHFFCTSYQHSRPRMVCAQGLQKLESLQDKMPDVCATDTCKNFDFSDMYKRNAYLYQR